MPKFFVISESLIRYDMAPHGAAEVYPAGTALNVASNLATLSNDEVHLVTALSTSRESAIFKQFCATHRISLSPLFENKANIGSYQLYRTHTLLGWEVIYNRNNSVWSALMNDWKTPLETILQAMHQGDHLHFDGISLLTHPLGFENFLALVKGAKKLDVTISFDLNVRKSLLTKPWAEFVEELKQILKHVTYCNIGLELIAELVSVSGNKMSVTAAFLREFGNLKAVFGYEKKVAIEVMSIEPFLATHDSFMQTDALSFKPQEQIGLGDAFCAFVLHQLLSVKEVDLSQAASWAAMKSYYLGDASVMTKQEFDWALKGINVKR